MSAWPDGPPRAEVEISLPARMSSLPDFVSALEEVCAHARVDDESHHDLRVVLDEACSNVIRYAYSGTECGALRLAVVHRTAPPPAKITMTLSDQGHPFDPLSLPTPELSLEPEDRPIGGLGVHLIRQLTDEQSYEYSPSAGNRLTIVKRLPAETERKIEQGE